MKVEGIVRTVMLGYGKEGVSMSVKGASRASTAKLQGGEKVDGVGRAASSGKVDEGGGASLLDKDRVRIINDKLFELKVVFAVTDEGDLVIRLIDEKGNTVRQIPPADFLRMVRRLKDVTEAVFHKKV